MRSRHSGRTSKRVERGETPARLRRAGVFLHRNTSATSQQSCREEDFVAIHRPIPYRRNFFAKKPIFYIHKNHTLDFEP